MILKWRTALISLALTPMGVWKSANGQLTELLATRHPVNRPVRGNRRLANGAANPAFLQRALTQ